jgi:hypothetical protein
MLVSPRPVYQESMLRTASNRRRVLRRVRSCCSLANGRRRSDLAPERVGSSPALNMTLRDDLSRVTPLISGSQKPVDMRFEDPPPMPLQTYPNCRT